MNTNHPKSDVDQRNIEELLNEYEGTDDDIELNIMVDGVISYINNYYCAGEEWCLDELNRDLNSCKNDGDVILKAIRLGVSRITHDIDLLWEKGYYTDENSKSELLSTIKHLDLELNELQTTGGDGDLNLEGLKRAKNHFEVLASNQTMYQYKKRRLFKIDGVTVVNDEVYHKAFINVINVVIAKITGKRVSELDWYYCTSLYQQIPTISLLKNINISYLIERCRNLSNDDHKSVNIKFDESPINALKKEFITEHISKLLTDTPKITKQQLIDASINDHEDILFDTAFSIKLAHLLLTLERYEGEHPKDLKRQLKQDDHSSVDINTLKRWASESFEQFHSKTGP